LIEPGEVWENPVSLERVVIVAVPWSNDEGRKLNQLTGRPRKTVEGSLLI
jgi:hypothetical protein